MPSFTQISLALIASASVAFSRPTLSTRQLSNETTSATLAITGATDGGIQSRREIHDLMQDTDQWNIYLLALQQFQSTDPSDPLSWYSIGGIHGQPFVEYNGAPQCDGCEAVGYCTHSSTLFPTWHRAYVALYEQSLQANALYVASQFTGDEQQRYLAAAQNLRSPYWDWALASPEGEDPFPQFFTDATVNVYTPSGEQTIPNPLLQYTFQDSAFNGPGVTSRAPTMSVQTRQQVRSDLWTLLTSQGNYNQFSTRALNQQRDNPNSLEAIHDSIHTDIGSTMGDAELAGFDPAFWLHHTMVDRAFALYQAAWPENWLESTDEVGQSFTYRAGSVEDASSVLAPFNVNSDAIKDTSYFNYNYADLASGPAADIINDLYGTQAPSDSPPALTPSKRSDEQASTNVTHEYMAHVSADLPGTEGSFDLFIFDGQPDASPATWYKDADFLGQHGFFTDANVKGKGDMISSASISLTAALQRRLASGAIVDLEPRTVEQYLKDKMQWRVVDRFDKEVRKSSISKLTVNIVTADVEMPAERGVMPRWSPFQQLVGCESDIGAYINGWCANV